MLKRFAILAGLFFVALALGAAAQTTAQISGTISAADGSVIPGAQVQVTNLGTNAVHTVQTGPHGTYVVRDLPVGSYSLSASMSGFKKFVQNGIVLAINSSPVVNVTLQVGQTTQTVEVHSNASMVAQVSSGVGQVIQPEQIADLPLNGRQATDLIALSGAAVVGTGGGLTGTLDFPTAVSYSVAGSQQNATTYTLDGAPNMDYRTNIGEPLPFPDALQEFKVASSAQPANSSNRPGGEVTAITKSGTNNFHGDVFEYLRNGVMDAEGYTLPANNGPSAVAPPSVRDNLKRNQFGGTIGGPVLHNKLFFFYGFQGTTERQQTPPTTMTIPTAAMLQGDFSTFLSSACGRPNQYLNTTIASPNGGAPQPLTGTTTNASGQTVSNNIILSQWLATPSAAVNAKLAAMYGTPYDQCGDATRSNYQHDNEFQNVARVDWQRTASDSLYVRYFVDSYNLLSYLAPGQINLLTSSGAGLDDRYQSVAIGDTHVLSPTMVNSFNINFGRSTTNRTGNSRIPTLCSLGANVTCPVANFVTGLTISPGFEGYDYENVFGATENLGWQFGNHYLEIGATWQHLQMNGDGSFQQDPWPRYSNGNGSYTGNNIADFVTGNVDSFLQGNGQVSRDGQNLPALYFNDNWKIAPTVNLTYGVRWQPFFPQHSGYKYASDFSLAAYQASQFSKVFPNAPPGITFPGDAGFNGRSDTNNVLSDFAPTVGISWDPSGNGSEAIRAGYGVSYDTSVLWNTMHVVLNPPWGGTASFTPAPVNVTGATAGDGGGIANPYFGIPGGNPFPTPTPTASFVFPPTGTYVFEAQNAKPARSQQWNVSIQKQFGSNWMASATYIGSHTSRIWAGVNLDPSVVITAGMTAPGIVSTSGMTGINGPCTLDYLGQNVNFPTCNGTSRESVNGVSNENARRTLTLQNPLQGPKFNGGLVQAQSIGYANYNGLLLSLRRRLSNGLSIMTNYTWSHCLDNAESGQDISNAFQNPSNPGLEYSNCSTDHRGQFNLSIIAQSPTPASGFARAIVSNWTISGVVTAYTGSPFTVTTGSDVSLTGVGRDRPNQVGNPFQAGAVSGNPSCSAPSQVNTIKSWFNPCAFVAAPAGSYGSVAPYSLYGPGNWNVNTAMWRNFNLTERTTMALRIEAFNVLNHPQLGNPGSTLSSTSTRGLISGTSGQNRIMQVAVKFTF